MVFVCVAARRGRFKLGDGRFSKAVLKDVAQMENPGYTVEDGQAVSCCGRPLSAHPLSLLAAVSIPFRFHNSQFHVFYRGGVGNGAQALGGKRHGRACTAFSKI